MVAADHTKVDTTDDGIELIHALTDAIADRIRVLVGDGTERDIARAQSDIRDAKRAIEDRIYELTEALDAYREDLSAATEALDRAENARESLAQEVESFRDERDALQQQIAERQG